MVYRAEGLRNPHVRAPQTVTCRVGSGESPAALSSLLPAIKESKSSEAFAEDTSADHDETSGAEVKDCSVVLAGLHACGDLSAIMLRFVTLIFANSSKITAIPLILFSVSNSGSNFIL